MVFVNRKILFLVSVLMAMLLVTTTACTTNNGDQGGAKNPGATSNPSPPPPASQPPVENSPQPVELIAYNMVGDMDYDRFMELYGSHMQKKHPHLSFKFMNNKDETKFAEMVVTHQEFDLFYGTPTGFHTLVEAGYTNLDLSDLAKKHHFDLSLIEPAALEFYLGMNNGTLNGLPVSLLHTVLVYNTDIFDKFGEAYLWDGMTWDETLDKARSLTRQADGVQYVGFGIQFLTRLFDNNQYGEDTIDRKTNKARLTESKWVDMFRQLSAFYEIPGNEYAGPGTTPTYNLFVQDRRLAMNVMLNSQVVAETVIPGDLNHDVVQLPVFRDTPGVGAGGQPNFFSVSSTSKHQEDAFLAMSVLLSQEVQAERARVSGSFPIVRIPDLETIMAGEVPRMQGKNVKGLIPSKFAAINMPAPTGVGPAANLQTAFAEVVRGQKDINTALRDANEKTDGQLEQARVAAGK